MLISDTPFKKTRANVAKQIQIATDCNDIFFDSSGENSKIFRITVPIQNHYLFSIITTQHDWIAVRTDGLDPD